MAVVTRLFDNHNDALEAVSALERAGVESERISLISNNSHNWHDGHAHAGDGRRFGDMNGDGENDVAEGAGKGAATGAFWAPGRACSPGSGCSRYLAWAPWSPQVGSRRPRWLLRRALRSAAPPAGCWAP